MIYPEADKLENWGTKYSLVVLAAKRAKQLKSRAPALIDTDSTNALTVALEEIAAGVINCSVPDNDLIIPVEEETNIAALLPLDSDDLEPAETLVVDEEEEEDVEEDEELDPPVETDDESEDELETPAVAEIDDEEVGLDEKESDDEVEIADEGDEVLDEDEVEPEDDAEPEEEE